MVATYDAAEELAARLEECRPRRVEIWDLFARDFNQKAELVTFLIDLGFSLTADQVIEMEQSPAGIPAAALSDAQQAFLSRAEPLARELGFLAHLKDQILLGSSLRYDARGHVEFAWLRPEGQAGLGINWLPYSQCQPQARAGFAKALRAWRCRREWLVGHHYAEFRQLADCCRLVFEVGMSLSPDQITRVVEPAGTPVAALRPEQRALLTAAGRLYPLHLPGRVSASSARFEPGGQFWLIQPRGLETHSYGTGWLPYSWQ